MRNVDKLVKWMQSRSTIPSIALGLGVIFIVILVDFFLLIVKSTYIATDYIFRSDKRYSDREEVLSDEG